MGIMTSVTQPGVLLIASGLLALGLKPGNGLSAHDVQLPFEATFAGVSNAGSVWEGRLRGAAAGRGRVILYQVEGPLQAANPVWHTQARWTVAADRGGRSFTAELEGMVDWKTGATRLSGVITAGWMKGAWVEQTGQFLNGDVSGTLEVAPTVAAR